MVRKIISIIILVFVSRGVHPMQERCDGYYDTINCNDPHDDYSGFDFEPYPLSSPVRSLKYKRPKPQSFPQIQPSQFLRAIRKGDLLQIKSACNSGMNILISDGKGRNTLHCAVLYDQLDILVFLVEFIVAKYGLEFLEKYCGEKDKFGNTPIFYAVKENFVDVFAILLKHNSDLCSKSLSIIKNKETTSLIYRLTLYCYRNNKGQALLHYAAKEGDLEVACWLVGLGFPVNAQDQNGDTPLHIAKRKKYYQYICDYLIDMGADSNLRNSDGKTPIDIEKAYHGEIEDISMKDH